MKILFSSFLFEPSVGGLETVSKILVEKFAAVGNEVHVITQTPGGEVPGANYRITRRPSISELRKLLGWCDLFFQNNISLRSLVPALLLGKKVLVVHQTWLVDTRGRLTWNNRLKRALLPRVSNVAISDAIAGQISGHSFVIGNPYDEATFRLRPNVIRDKSLIYVGRLVSDKGVDLLLRALKLLQDENLFPDLTIVGSGPEQEKLQEMTRELALDRSATGRIRRGEQVTFAGQEQGMELAELLNQHQILVVPSRWAEPFGVVALEGIACGCVVVGSEQGGLKEAIGPCGLTFQNGDVAALAAQLKRLLTERQLQTTLREKADEHLAKFKSDAVAAAYLGIMQKL
jgi:glycogen synthase